MDLIELFGHRRFHENNYNIVYIDMDYTYRSTDPWDEEYFKIKTELLSYLRDEAIEKILE